MIFYAISRRQADALISQFQLLQTTAPCSHTDKLI